MNKTKILAAALAALLALSMTACGNKAPEEPETAAPEIVSEEILTQAEDVSDIDAKALADESLTDAQAAEDETEAVGAEAETEAATEAETEAENKTPETVEEIVEFYKKAAAETDKGTVKGTDQMTMTKLDGGSGVVGGLISLFEPIAKSALEKNSGTVDDITGGYEKLTAADVTSATAKNDGKYTTVRINLKPQTDGMNGKSKEGSVGHGVSVLDGVQHAIDELKGVSVDTSEGSITLNYNNAYIDAKIDNATGKIVSGKWHYTVNILINNVKAKIGIVSAPLKDATGTVEYTVTI